ncbi:MAG: RloB domain-containing protein [Succinivibrionaceae bacterium]|nr:RloB domain-containing protein [Succinivibrionaceae bacterium]
MGSDDLFKKRKARRLKDQQRRIGFCKSYDRVLIVCEGVQTEPLYFECFKEEYDLSSANIIVTDASINGSDPMSIIKYAEKLYKESQTENNAFDRVFCVFDKDQHSNYDTALRELSNAGSHFTAITSVPCFEYWFLLHFEYTTKPFSSASSVISELKRYIPFYAKNNSGVFFALKDKMITAIRNAENVNAYVSRISTDNPSTKVVDLVKYLLELNKKR